MFLCPINCFSPGKHGKIKLHNTVTRTAYSISVGSWSHLHSLHLDAKPCLPAPSWSVFCLSCPSLFFALGCLLASQLRLSTPPGASSVSSHDKPLVSPLLPLGQGILATCISFVHGFPQFPRKTRNLKHRSILWAEILHINTGRFLQNHLEGKLVRGS